MHNDGLNKGAVQLTSQLFSCPHNRMFIPHCTHNIMTSGYLGQQSRQQNCVTNSRTTIRTPPSEIPIVEDEITIREREIVNCEPYDINAIDSIFIDRLRFEFHDFEHHTTERPTTCTTVKSSEIGVESRKLIPKTDGDKRSALLFDYKLILPVLITVLVLLVMSYVIFCFLYVSNWRDVQQMLNSRSL